MNYYAARERQRDHRFDYTVRNNRTGTHAVGYCALPIPLKPGYLPADVAAEEEAFRARHAAKYHDTGHATKEEACACYKDYLLDRWEDAKARGAGGGRWSGSQHRCKECGAWTSEFVQIDQRHLDFCPEHQTREIVAKHVTVGESISSY